MIFNKLYILLPNVFDFNQKFDLKKALDSLQLL